MTKPTIGFIGLGLMGRAMVLRLLDQGYGIRVLGNRDRSGIEAAVAAGATEAPDAQALTEGADLVFLCLGTSEHVESRIYGDRGVLAGTRPGQIVVDFGTSLPDSTLKIGAALAEKGAIYMDAPLGRTPSHGREGKLNIMAAGDRAAFDSIRPVLDDLGENVFHLGPLATGHRIKLINNFFAMTTASAMAEAFAMADASAIPRETLYGVMAAGPLRSGMMDFIRNYATNGQIDLAFSIANAAKDVGYYRQMAEGLGARSRMSGAADATLREARDNGMADAMVPQIVDYLSRNLKG